MKILLFGHAQSLQGLDQLVETAGVARVPFARLVGLGVGEALHARHFGFKGGVARVHETDKAGNAGLSEQVLELAAPPAAFHDKHHQVQVTDRGRQVFAPTGVAMEAGDELFQGRDEPGDRFVGGLAEEEGGRHALQIGQVLLVVGVADVFERGEHVLQRHAPQLLLVLLDGRAAVGAAAGAVIEKQHAEVLELFDSVRVGGAGVSLRDLFGAQRARGRGTGRLHPPGHKRADEFIRGAFGHKVLGVAGIAVSRLDVVVIVAIGIVRQGVVFFPRE